MGDMASCTNGEFSNCYKCTGCTLHIALKTINTLARYFAHVAFKAVNMPCSFYALWAFSTGSIDTASLDVIVLMWTSACTTLLLTTSYVSQQMSSMTLRPYFYTESSLDVHQNFRTLIIERYNMLSKNKISVSRT